MLLSQEKLNIKFFNYFFTSDFKVKYYYFDCFFFNNISLKKVYLTSYWYFYKRFFMLHLFNLSSVYIRTFFNYNFIFNFNFKKLIKLTGFICVKIKHKIKWS